MRHLKDFFIAFFVFSCLLGMTGCSSENGEGETSTIDLTKLVGSEWESSFISYGDEGSYTNGNEVMVFNSSYQAKVTGEYHGMEWDYNYSTGEDELKPFHTTGNIFYEYTVSDNIIILNDGEYETKYKIVGRQLVQIGGDRVWELIKEGDGVEDELHNDYTWENMSGFWMNSDPYVSHRKEIERLERMFSASNAYLRGTYFHCWGMHFNSLGQRKDIVLETRLFQNEQTLYKISTSDAKTVYWTNIERNSYTYIKYEIHGNEIYYANTLVYTIIDENTITDSYGNVYVRGISNL